MDSDISPAAPYHTLGKGKSNKQAILARGLSVLYYYHISPVFFFFSEKSIARGRVSLTLFLIMEKIKAKISCQAHSSLEEDSTGGAKVGTAMGADRDYSLPRGGTG